MPQKDFQLNLKATPSADVAMHSRLIDEVELASVRIYTNYSKVKLW